VTDWAESNETGALRVIPLGGLGEIGLNMMVLEYEGTAVVVDAGLMFPEDYMLGIDIVIPDFEHLRLLGKKLAAVILTHCHEDHIGAIPFLLKEFDVPVYGTRFTLEMVRHKLEERGLLAKARLHTVEPRQFLGVGPFTFEFIRVSHSVVDGVGLAIRTPVGLLVHTGDFRITHVPMGGDSTDLGRFAQLGEEGVFALFSDSTNVEKEGYTLSEQVIGKRLESIVQTSPGRVIVAVFASNIRRIEQIVEIAKKRGSRIVFNGRSMEVSVRIACELGYMDVPEEMVIDVGQVKDFPDDQVVMVTTGSQGEPMSALARMASGSHKQIKIKKGDTVILSSKFIPGNEKAIAAIINSLYRKGAEVIYEKISDIHVSGHAFQEELKMMLQLTRPRYFVPIHGEYRHLIHHGRLAALVGIPEERVLLAENGDVLCFDRHGARIEGKVPTGRTFVDGKGVGDVGRSVLRERRALSEEGMVVVTMVLDEETGTVVYGPEIASRGFVFEMEKGHLLEDAKCVILEVLEEMDPSVQDRVRYLAFEVQRALRQYFNYVIQRRPVILPMIVEV